MKTVLVPIDFSENALDAAQYAFDSSSQFDVDQVILYHSNTVRNNPNGSLLNKLEEIKEQLTVGDGIAVRCVVDNEILTEGIAVLANKYHASLIVMGITGRNKVGRQLIGSNVFHVSQYTELPVLIVPAKVHFKKIESVALALPMIKDLKRYTPRDDIKAIVESLDAKLMIVNVSRSKDKTPKTVLYAGLADIFEMFDDLSPSYHFLTGNNTVESVTGFADHNDAQLLISISGKYGFLEGMFKSSVTKKLAYHAGMPLLIYRSRTGA